MSGLHLHRLGVVMRPQAGNPHEVEGVLNPAAARGPDGHLYLFPRLVARGNYSRIGMARVRFDAAGNPVGVERLGVVLEPEMDYERRGHGHGGCEDPRITYIESIRCWLLTYTAFSTQGPRIALALSEDLFHWQRLGLARFAAYRGINFADVHNKDASTFPIALPNHAGKLQLAMLHRPLFRGSCPEDTVSRNGLRAVDADHESIWISYCPMPRNAADFQQPGLFNSHRRLAGPVAPWERLKIGAGTPPVMTPHGWLLIYHGVSKLAERSGTGHHLCYSAGLMLLSHTHPGEILYRSPQPILSPLVPEERSGTVDDVVFPTGIDQRHDLDQPNRFDVYYGMADSSIGVARLDLPETLPAGGTCTQCAERI